MPAEEALIDDCGIHRRVDVTGETDRVAGGAELRRMLGGVRVVADLARRGGRRVHVGLRKRLRDVVVTARAGAVAVGRQLKPKWRAMRIVTRRTIAGRHRRVPVRLLQSIADLLVARDAQRGGVAARCAGFQSHAPTPGDGADNVARAAPACGNRAVHHTTLRDLVMTGGARRSIAAGDRRMLCRRRRAGGEARSVRAGQRLSRQSESEEHESYGPGHYRLPGATSRRYAVMAFAAAPAGDGSMAPYDRGSTPLISFARSKAVMARRSSPAACSR